MKSLDLVTRHDHLEPSQPRRVDVAPEPARRTSIPAATIRRSARVTPTVPEPRYSFASAVNAGIHRIARTP